MSYQLRTGEGLGDGVRRVCRGQIALAMQASHSERSAENSPVHRTRKHLKKARAALRFLESAVERDEFERARKRLRNIARLLSDIRDAEVRFHTVQQLGHLLQINDDDLLHDAEAFLGLELDSFLAAFSDWKEEAHAGLTKVSRQMKDWDVAALSCKQVRRTVQEAYKSGRISLRAATKTPTAASFHDFRKRAKELMYQLRVLAPLHPLLLQQQVSYLKVLTEHLGNAHDLAFLEQRLIKHSRKGKADQAAEALSELIGLREKELQRTAAALGERFYAEKPKTFARRISHYFEEWEMAKAGHIASVKEIARAATASNGLAA